jgi:hypothetical protein
MNNLAKAKLDRLLSQTLKKITPYPLNYSLKLANEFIDDWDYKTDVAARLVEDFSKRKGFRNKADASMLHDELVTALIPSTAVGQAEFKHGETYLRLQDSFWTTLIAESTSGGDCALVPGLPQRVVVDLREETTQSWTSLRTDLYLNLLKTTAGVSVIDFRPLVAKVCKLTRSDCLDILSDPEVSRSLAALHEKHGRPALPPATSDGSLPEQQAAIVVGRLSGLIAADGSRR